MWVQVLLRNADTLNTMLEPEVEELASVEADPRPATRSEERHWALAIVVVLAATLLAVWLLGQAF